MDRLDTYRQIIRNALQPYTQIAYANVTAKNRQIFDSETKISSSASTSQKFASTLDSH
jgi:hypothetical protein